MLHSPAHNVYIHILDQAHTILKLLLLVAEQSIRTSRQMQAGPSTDAGGAQYLLSTAPHLVCLPLNGRHESLQVAAEALLVLHVCACVKHIYICEHVPSTTFKHSLTRDLSAHSLFVCCVQILTTRQQCKLHYRSPPVIGRCSTKPCWMKSVMLCDMGMVLLWSYRYTLPIPAKSMQQLGLKFCTNCSMVGMRDYDAVIAARCRNTPEQGPCQTQPSLQWM